jgi:hypothetical protein
MKFAKKTPMVISTQNPADTNVNPPALLKDNLGFLTGLKVKRATHRAKANVQVEIVQAIAAATKDITLTDIEYQQTQIKTAMGNKNAVRQGALAAELLARVGVVHEQLTDIQAEGFFRLVGQRMQLLETVEKLRAKGELTDSEAEAASEFIRTAITHDAERLATNAARAKDAVDNLAARTTDHIHAQMEK